MKIEVKTTAILTTLEVTAAEWQLFTFEYKKRCKLAASELNESIVFAVNAGCSRKETTRLVNVIQRRHRDLGADDTEPDQVLCSILDKIYGKA